MSSCFCYSTIPIAKINGLCVCQVFVGLVHLVDQCLVVLSVFADDTVYVIQVRIDASVGYLFIMEQRMHAVDHHPEDCLLLEARAIRGFYANDISLHH